MPSRRWLTTDCEFNHCKVPVWPQLSATTTDTPPYSDQILLCSSSYIAVDHTRVLLPHLPNVDSLVDNIHTSSSSDWLTDRELHQGRLNTVADGDVYWAQDTTITRLCLHYLLSLAGLIKRLTPIGFASVPRLIILFCRDDFVYQLLSFNQNIRLASWLKPIYAIRTS